MKKYFAPHWMNQVKKKSGKKEENALTVTAVGQLL